MMIKDRMTYRWLWSCLIAGGLLLTGCGEKSEEDVIEPDPGNRLELGSLTRTDNATPYADNGCSIRAYLTEATSVVKEDGLFEYTGLAWSSNLSVKEEHQYYLYGYMPSSISGTFAKPTNGEYSDGVDITFTNLKDITDLDVCVVVGVQRIDGPSVVANVQEGNYSYLSGIVGKNYVNLLMGHLYSSLQLAFKIDDEYSMLRSILLKEIKLKSTYGNVTTTVNIRRGRGVGTPTFTKVGSDANPSVDFLSTSDSPLLLNRNYITNPLTIDKLVYCAPGIFDSNGTYVSITSTYDVLDKEGNSLGERTSTNKLKITASSLVPGQKKTVVLTVKPTYLYILSDYDLDDPEITIE